MRFPFILQQKSCNTLLARIGALGKERINLSAVADMTRLDSDRRHSPRLVGAKLAHQKAYRLRVVDPKVRRYARCRHFLFSFPFKGIAPQTKSNASIAFMPRKVNGVFLRNWRAENAAKMAALRLSARRMCRGRGRGSGRCRSRGAGAARQMCREWELCRARPMCNRGQWGIESVVKSGLPLTLHSTLSTLHL